MQEQQSVPMNIIVVRGHSRSSTGRSKVATKLATYLKYSLIDQDVLAKTLQSSDLQSLSLSSSQDNLSNLSFELLYQIASAQLRTSNLRVIINSPLSNPTHLDRLKQLVIDFGGPQLILIECRPPDEIEDYDVGVIGRKLTVDTTEPFHVEEFVSLHLHLRPSLPKAEQLKTEKPNTPRDRPEKKSSFRSAKRVTEGIPHPHLHALLSSIDQPKIEAGILYCKCCQKSIEGSYYHCPEVDCKYIFDESCAKSPSNLDIVRQESPAYLIAREPEYRFLEKQMFRCNICESENKGFSKDCHDCLFDTNMRGKFLPIVVKHESHDHHLNLIIMPPSLNYEYECCGCGEFGKSISYRCYDCNFNLHVGCVLLSSTVKSEHHIHDLSLNYNALDHNYWEKGYCEVCKKERSPELWFYFCGVCETVIHIGCVSVG